MAYTIGQYNKNRGSDDTIFLRTITRQEGTQQDIGPKIVTYVPKQSAIQEELGLKFQDIAIYYSTFKSGQAYYFHCKVKRRNRKQHFYINLINSKAVPGTDDYVEQFVKEIIIPGPYVNYEDASKKENDYNTEGWYDLEFTFTPIIDFDTLWFELWRTKEDYTGAITYPKIIFEELSTVQNVLKDNSTVAASFSNMDSGIIKMGIQSRPHLWMFLNGEDIRTDRSGIYEIKNANVLVTSFSVINGNTFLPKVIDGVEHDVVIDAMKAIDEPLPLLDDEPQSVLDPNPLKDESWETTPCQSIINETVKREIDSFTMDYMFRDKPSNNNTDGD